MTPNARMIATSVHDSVTRLHTSASGLAGGDCSMDPSSASLLSEMR